MMKCEIPPPGWKCSRVPGHSGPCAATRSNVSLPIVVDREQLIYVPVAKAASSSIKLGMRRAAGMSDPKPWWKIHETVWPDAITEEKLKSYFVFSCVRHPLSRLYSCWKSKFHVDRFRDLQEHKSVFDIRMSFSEFVEALKKIDLHSANEHICPQSTILRPYKFDKIFKTEQLETDFSIFPLPHINETHSTPIYTVESWETIQHLYREDMVTYGY